jgi:hypothetical protein
LTKQKFVLIVTTQESIYTTVEAYGSAYESDDNRYSKPIGLDTENTKTYPLKVGSDRLYIQDRIPTASYLKPSDSNFGLCQVTGEHQVTGRHTHRSIAVYYKYPQLCLAWGHIHTLSSQRHNLKFTYDSLKIYTDHWSG